MTVLTLATLALRITLILGAVGIVNSLRRRSSAGSRHWLWMLALAGVAILPLAARLTPPLRVVPWSPPAAIVATPAGSVEAVRTSAADAVSDERNVPSVASPVISVANVGVTESAATPIDLQTAIAIIWILGALVFVARLIRAHIVARRILGSSYITRQPPIESVEVRYSADVELPFTYGLMKPVIILPASADSWSASQMKATLTHEMAHARRGDGLALLVTQFVVALYWWHPVVWVAARAAAADRERACDDAVLREGMRASDYGQCLLAHADTVSAWKSKPLATVMFGHSAGIGARVAALLDPAIDRSSAARPSISVVAAVLGFVVLVGAAAPSEMKRVPNLSQSTTQTAMPLVSASIVPVAPFASVAGNTEADPSLCRQAKDSRHARTYRNANISIQGAGGDFNDGVSREIWTGLDCIGWLQFSGQVDASADEKTIVVGSGGRFVAHNEGPDGVRDYLATDGSSSMKLNGQSVTIGSAEQQWIAGMAREFLRRTGKRVHERARAALASGGLPALLAEAALVPSSDVRAAYLAEGFANTRDARSVSQFIDQGASLLDSSDSRGRFLLAVPESYRDDVGVLAHIYREASVIEPDGPVEKVLASTSPPRPLPSVLQPLMEKIIDGIQISERRTALRAYYLGLRP